MVWNAFCQAAIEQVPNAPNFLALASSLKSARQQGLIPLVTIGAIDTNHVSVPPDLINPNDSSSLRDGLSWTSSEVIDRYAEMIMVAAPLVAYYGGAFISVGNEVDVNLAAHPETGVPFVEFAIQIRDFIQNLTSPDMAVGATLTVGGLNAFVSMYVVSVVMA